MLSEIETKSLIISLVVILLVLYIICNLNKQLSYGGNNTIHKLKELDIMFLKMATCPYCIKMESLLLSKNLLSYMYVIDVQTQDGRQLAQKHGCTGFPSFVSRKTGKKTSGYTEDIEQLLKDLEYT